MRRPITAGMPWRPFVRDARGISAVEFSFVLPVMVIISFGSLEYARAITSSNKVAILSRTVADLTSQDPTKAPIAAATMNDIVASARLVLMPYPSADAKIVVSALGVDLTKNSANPTVCSSFASSNATKRSVGVASSITISDGFKQTGMRYVLSEVSLDYTPLFGSSLLVLIGYPAGGLTFQSSTAWPTRGGQSYKENPYSEIVLPGGKEC